MIVRELITKIGFNVDENKLQKAESGFQNLVKTAGALASKFAIVGAAVTAAFAAAGGSLFAAVKATADVGDEAIKTAQKIGVNVEAFQRLAYAGKLADLSQEGLATSLKFLSRNMVEAKEGTKEAVDAFKKIGLDPKKYLNDTEGMLIAIADKIAAMPDGAEKTALALELMGRSGTEAIPFLNQGGKAIRDLGLEAELFGLVIREQAAKQSEEFNDNLTRLGSIVLGLRNSIGGALLPIFGEVVQKMVAWYKVNGQIIKGGLTKFFERVGLFIQRIIPPLTRIGSAIARIFGGAGADAGETFLKILESIASYIEISVNMLADFYEAIEKIVNSPLGQFFIKSFYDPIKKAFQLIFLLLDDFAAFVRGDDSLVGEMIKAAQQIVSEWTNLFGAMFEYLKTGFMEAAEAAKDLFSINPLKVGAAIEKLKSGKAFTRSSEALINVKKSLDPIAQQAQQGSFDPLQRAFHNIRAGNILGVTSSTVLPSAPSSPALSASGVRNNNVKGSFEIKVPPSALVDEIKNVVQEVFATMLRQADGATNPAAV